MDKSELEALFKKSFPFWEKMSENDKNTFYNTAHSVTFKKGTVIHDGGECTGVILIRSGCLSLSIASKDGREITLYRLFTGDMCVLSASCVLDSITFDVCVNAEEDSECTVVSGCAIEALTLRLAEAKIFMLETALSRFSDVMWVMEQILFMSMDKRLAIFLLDESAKNGSDTVKLTHEQIAKYMGSAREVVSRMLKYFKEESIVSLSRSDGVRILDRGKLRELSVQ